MQDNIKLAIFNMSVFTLSFANIEDVLRIVLLNLSIGYTCIMIWKILHKQEKNDDK